MPSPSKKSLHATKQFWLAIPLLVSVLLFIFAPLYTDYISDFYGKPRGGGEFVEHYGYEIFPQAFSLFLEEYRYFIHTLDPSTPFALLLIAMFCYLALLPILSLTHQLFRRDPDPLIILSKRRSWQFVSCLLHIGITVLAAFFLFLFYQIDESHNEITRFGVLYLVIIFWVLLRIIVRRARDLHLLPFLLPTYSTLRQSFRVWHLIFPIFGIVLFVLFLLPDGYLDGRRKNQSSFPARKVNSVVFDRKTTQLPEGADPKTYVVLRWGYAKDATHVWKDGVSLPGVDAPSFELLDSGYAKDKQHVYSLQIRTMTILPGADPNTITIENLSTGFTEHPKRPFLKDKNHVYDYYDSGAVVPDADPDTFQFLSEDYAVDRDTVFAVGGMVLGGGISIIPQADPATFSVFPSPYDFYARDAHAVYVHATIIKGADPLSFVPLKGSLSRDDHRVYIFSEAIQGADPKTAEPVEPQTELMPIVWKDKAHVYVGNSIIDDADPASFVMLSENEYNVTARDKDTFFGSTLRKEFLSAYKNVDPNTAVLLERYLLKDKRAVYSIFMERVEIEPGARVHLVKVPEADPATFVDLGNGFYRDSDDVFFAGEPWTDYPYESKIGTPMKKLEGIDADSMHLEVPYVYSDTHVYCNGKRLYELDGTSFNVLPHGYSTDSKTVFKGCQEMKIVADPATFTVIDATYSKDRLHVYRGYTNQDTNNTSHSIVAGADPKTFQVPSH